MVTSKENGETNPPKENYFLEKCKKFDIIPERDTNSIIGVNDIVLVYLDRNDNLMWNWNIDELSLDEDVVSKITAKTQILTSRISSLFDRSRFGGSKKEAKIAKRLVGASLFAGISGSVTNGTSQKDENYFLEAEEFINTKIKERTHIAYLMSSFIFFSIIFSIVIFAAISNFEDSNLVKLNVDKIEVTGSNLTNKTVKETPLKKGQWLHTKFEDISAINQLLIAILCGATGALLSVIQRFKEIPIQNYMSKL